MSGAPFSDIPAGVGASARATDTWTRVDRTATFHRFARCFCAVSGWFLERGPTNVLFLARPVRGAAGFFTAHVVALTTTTSGRERLRFEPVGSFTVRRRGRIDLSLVGGLASLVARRIEEADSGPVNVTRGAFLGKLKASEIEFERLR